MTKINNNQTEKYLDYMVNNVEHFEASLEFPVCYLVLSCHEEAKSLLYLANSSFFSKCLMNFINLCDVDCFIDRRFLSGQSTCKSISIW